jgi:hypothetical protein
MIKADRKGKTSGLENLRPYHRMEMSAEWKVRFAICIASVAIQAFIKLLFSFSDVLKTTNCTFQEVDNILIKYNLETT